MIPDIKLNGEPVTIYMVEWEDCESMEGWQFEKDIEDFFKRPLSIMLSVGWLLQQNDDWVILAQSVDLNQEDGFKAGDLMKIPRRMISKILEVNPLVVPRMVAAGNNERPVNPVEIAGVEALKDFS